jgi:hypothetical protein
MLASMRLEATLSNASSTGTAYEKVGKEAKQDDLIES